MIYSTYYKYNVYTRWGDRLKDMVQFFLLNDTSAQSNLPSNRVRVLVSTLGKNGSLLLKKKGKCNRSFDDYHSDGAFHVSGAGFDDLLMKKSPVQIRKCSFTSTTESGDPSTTDFEVIWCENLILRHFFYENIGNSNT